MQVNREQEVDHSEDHTLLGRLRHAGNFIRRKTQADPEKVIGALAHPERLLDYAKVNQKEIESAFEQIILVPKGKETGVICQTRLRLTNPLGEARECTLRYSIGKDVLVSNSGHTTKIVGRWEIFVGDPPKEIDYSIDFGKEIDYELERENKKHPVAFRELWYYPVPEVNQEGKEVDLIGFVHTHNSLAGVGISSALVDQCIQPAVIKDFVDRNQKGLVSMGVTDTGKVNVFMYDHTYLLPNKRRNMGWTERIAKKLGFSSIDRQKYKVAMGEGYVKHINQAK